MRERLTRAERQARTREELVSAAHARFVRDGFHATSVEQIATDAGYTKGAVYSNFASKEELFFAVYEREADRVVSDVEEAMAEATAADAVERLSLEAAGRRGRDDGWLAVFVEFWAHVVRHPEHRGRFAEIHSRGMAPFEALSRRVLEERGDGRGVDPGELTAAMAAMQLGLGLERLTRPDVVDAELGARMARIFMAAAVEAAVVTEGRGT